MLYQNPQSFDVRTVRLTIAEFVRLEFELFKKPLLYLNPKTIQVISNVDCEYLTIYRLTAYSLNTYNADFVFLNPISATPAKA